MPLDRGKGIGLRGGNGAGSVREVLLCLGAGRCVCACVCVSSGHNHALRLVLISTGDPVAGSCGERSTRSSKGDFAWFARDRLAGRSCQKEESG